MEPIEIAFAFDKNYILPTCVAMASIVHNTSRTCCFHLLCNELTEEDRALFLACASYNGSSMQIHPVDGEKYKRYYQGKAMPAIDFRFLLPEILPYIDKILYLDSDLVVEGDITELWNIDLGDHLVAASPDKWIHTDNMFHLALDIPISDIYFNAGVMLLNLRQLREENTQDQFFDCMPDIIDRNLRLGHSFLRDQNVFNYVFRGRVLELPPRMNMQSAFYLYGGPRLTLEAWAESVREPLIIHFSTKDKPFIISRQLMPYNWERYYYYKALSPLADPKDKERQEKYKQMNALPPEGPVVLGEMYARFLYQHLRETATQIQKENPDKTVVLWGAGDFVGTIMVMFAAERLYSECVVDGLEENWGKRIFDYTVARPEALKDKQGKTCVVLSTLKRHAAVDALLHEYGYTDDDIYYVMKPFEKLREPL